MLFQMQFSMFLTEAVPYGLARFGQGTGPVVLNNLLCSGSESSLLNCRSDGLGNIGTCTHADDAGVVCMEGNTNVIFK